MYIRVLMAGAVSSAFLGLAAAATHQAAGVHAGGDMVCNGDFGTNVKFVKTPSEAGRQAFKEEKLVFVLHVSGEFEDPTFT
jgi:hypothetical protein